MQIKCPECKINDSAIHPSFGVVACLDCRNKPKVVLDRSYEFIPEHIKEERKEFKDQTIQPFRNGQLSKEYLDLYGTKYIKATEEEVKNAKNVWSRELPNEYYKR